MREELIAKLMWNEGGMGMGLLPIANLFMSKLHSKEIRSCVAVSGPPDKYTDEELAKLVEFSEERSARHRKICGSILSSDNLICIGKMDGYWMNKMLSWEFGRMTSPTLDEAIAFMRS